MDTGNDVLCITVYRFDKKRNMAELFLHADALFCVYSAETQILISHLFLQFQTHRKEMHMKLNEIHDLYQVWTSGLVYEHVSFLNVFKTKTIVWLWTGFLGKKQRLILPLGTDFLLPINIPAARKAQGTYAFTDRDQTEVVAPDSWISWF